MRRFLLVFILALFIANLSQAVNPVGEIRLWVNSKSFPSPDNWFLCNGRSLSRTDYPELFARIGTKYGATDDTHFNLPNLIGRVLIGTGQRVNTAPTFKLGDKGGVESNHLTAQNLPAHRHTMHVSNAAASVSAPGTATSSGGAVLSVAKQSGYPVKLYGTKEPTEQIASTVDESNTSKAVNNMQPYLALYYLICFKSY